MATLDPLDQTTVTPPPAAGSTSLMMMDIPPAVVLTDDLIAEILSYLSVKNLMQLRTVCKAWKTLISNPTFVNLHLQRSPQNPYLTLKWFNHDKYFTVLSKVLSVFPVRPILENLPVNLDDEAFGNGVELIRGEYYYYYPSLEGEYNRIVGSCNGLLCFYSCKETGDSDGYSKYWLNFQNLAMGTKSEKLGQFLDSYTNYCFAFEFSFGYDNSTRTYKVVAFRLDSYTNYDSWTSEVKIFSLGENSWRTIESFPVPPLTCYVPLPRFGHSEPNDAVHLFGTINWLALTNTSEASLHGWTHINAETFVILSLSLSTETYTQLLLPKGLNVDLHVQPTLRVLANCLCFSYDFRGTEFVIWQMREFGVRESWTQLIKVSYQTLGTKNLPMGDRMYNFQLLPLYLSKDSDTLIFANIERDNPAFIYYRKDNRVERIRYSKYVLWFSTMDYVESLVPTP